MATIVASRMTLFAASAPVLSPDPGCTQKVIICRDLVIQAYTTRTSIEIGNSPTETCLDMVLNIELFRRKLLNFPTYFLRVKT